MLVGAAALLLWLAAITALFIGLALVATSLATRLGRA